MAKLPYRGGMMQVIEEAFTRKTPAKWDGEAAPRDYLLYP